MTNHTYRGTRVPETTVLVDHQTLPISEQGRNHAPTGFAWGYGGSGPAALAQSILSYEGLPTADYQHFKWQVLANLNHDGWTLTSEDIRRWANATPRDQALGESPEQFADTFTEEHIQ